MPIYQNMDFISGFDPEYVLILSGDHIYKMDYSKMLQYHIKKMQMLPYLPLQSLLKKQVDLVF